jgi:hypothetical protein
VSIYIVLTAVIWSMMQEMSAFDSNRSLARQHFRSNLALQLLPLSAIAAVQILSVLTVQGAVLNCMFLPAQALGDP